jgi:hypothetical protein
MPTQVTYLLPGHHWAGGCSARLIVHTQVTFVAPAAAKTSWMCCQAAMNVAGGTWPKPHGYQLPFHRVAETRRDPAAERLDRRCVGL